ncbi:DUF2716 domain-containing protein [Jiangella ureilytica]|uniref:DUF2716 domain-containing protein n=1 Tax=Jiangella ureilytica TaxID=2530374 RepID=A0A4R4RY91_9ACTN|nr:DUF2716 domain-containing protein [Jiangella ureilytica]
MDRLRAGRLRRVRPGPRLDTRRVRALDRRHPHPRPAPAERRRLTAGVTRVSRTGWDNEAWERIADPDRIWSAFDRQYRCRPDKSGDPAGRRGSGGLGDRRPVTGLRPVTGHRARRPRLRPGEDRRRRLVLDAFTEAFAEGTRLDVLDRQHVARWFWPHRQERLGEPWRVEPFPGGDRELCGYP